MFLCFTEEIKSYLEQYDEMMSFWGKQFNHSFTTKSKEYIMHESYHGIY